MIRALYLGPPELLEHVRGCLGAGYSAELANEDRAVEALLPETQVILDAYMRVRFDAERLARASKLALVVTATTGADHIDAAALAGRNIPLLTLKGQTEVLRSLTPAAEHSWLLHMACARRLRGAIADVLGGGWDRNKHPGVMFRGKTIGIIGCGRIGQHVGRYAEAFGMRRLGFDPHIDPWPAHIERTPLDELLAAADFVSVHVPLVPETVGLLGAKQLASLKPGAILVNTSRGEIVDEAAMLALLERGHLGAVGLDVLVGEPDVQKHPLLAYARTHDNLIITPHIGGFSPDAVKRVLAFSCERITGFFRA